MCIRDRNRTAPAFSSLFRLLSLIIESIVRHRSAYRGRCLVVERLQIAVHCRLHFFPFHEGDIAVGQSLLGNGCFHYVIFFNQSCRIVHIAVGVFRGSLVLVEKSGDLVGVLFGKFRADDQ